jgi:hypothetical protein
MCVAIQRLQARRAHDAVIRVYDEASNVMKRSSMRAIPKSGEFCWHHAALSTKMKFSDSAFVR